MTRTATAQEDTMNAPLALPASVYKYETREQWLEAAVYELRTLFRAEAGVTLPKVRVSVGWPGGSGSKNANVIGQCWASRAAKDGTAQLFISPTQSDALRVLDILAHELTHAADDCESGHRGEFVRVARAIGLAGKPTATVAGPFLARYLGQILARIGAFPHASLADAYGPKQRARMLLAVCRYGPNEDGETYKVRLTGKWIEEVGYPLCGCHEERMVGG